MRISSSLILLSLLSINASCGKWAKASPEATVTMPRPTYPQINGDVFALDGGKASTNYRGTMILFNDNATPQGVADIINVSVKSREAWAAMKKFEVESDYVRQYADNGVALKQLALMKQGLQAFELDALSKSPISAAAKLVNASTWIEREIAALNLTPEQTTSFNKSWGEYCEAKIIETATLPVLSQSTFKRLPLPTPICQKYYADRAFFTSPDCTSETGDYLKCMWLDGVMKTRWFTSPNEATDSALATARTDKRARLASMFSDANYEQTKGIYGFNEASFILTGSAVYKKLYFDKKEAFVNIAIDQKNDATCVKVIANIGSQDTCRIFGVSPEPRSPRQVISAVEGSAPDEKIFAKLPAPAAPRTLSTQQVIRYLNERSRPDTSESDRLFWEIKDGSALSQPTFANAGKDFVNLLPSFRTLLGAEFYGTFSAADAADRAVKAEAVKFEEQRISENTARWNVLNNAITASTDAGITAANSPGVAVGFLQYVMVFEQFGDVLSARFSFKEHENFAYRACFNLATNLGIDCPATLPLKSDTTFFPATLKRDADGGKLDFALTISPAVEMGMGPKARADIDRKPDFFLDLPTTETEGRTLRFELYRNRLDTYLDIMTGKAFIDENGTRRYEAGISMWEQSE